MMPINNKEPADFQTSTDSNIYPLPQPNELNNREKDDAMGGYFMMFAALAIGLPLPIINVIASVIYYYTNRNKGRFVRFHTLQALLSQIPTTLLNLGFTFWTLRLIFWEVKINEYYWAFVCMVVITNLWYIIACIMGAMRAKQGRMFYMLVFGIIAYKQVFMKKGDDNNVNDVVNFPPQM
jgi:uncharacterized membrane protein